MFTAAATVFLIFAGGMVTSTDSGLSVPDWPKSYGMWMPPMVGGVFYEHGHRMVAAAVGLLTVIQASCLSFFEPRRWVRRLGWSAVVTVIVQGLLGGLTVKLLLPPAVSISHACLAQAFLCLMVTLAVVTSRSWREADTLDIGGPEVRLRRLALASSIAIYVQLILGASMRHLKAGLAIPDFPLAMGGLVPPWESLQQLPVAIHFSHRCGALVVTILLGLAIWHTLKPSGRPLALRVPAWVLAVALPTQLTLGAITIWTQKLPIPTSLHVATGAFILASSMVLTLQTLRRYRIAVQTVEVAYA